MNKVKARFEKLLNWNAHTLSYEFITNKKLEVLIKISDSRSQKSVTLKKAEGDSSERETALRYLLGCGWPVVGWSPTTKTILIGDNPYPCTFSKEPKPMLILDSKLGSYVAALEQEHDLFQSGSLR